MKIINNIVIGNKSTNELIYKDISQLDSNGVINTPYSAVINFGMLLKK